MDESKHNRCGIIGGSLAIELARKGRTIIVLEKGKLGGEASSVAVGLLAPFEDSYLLLQRASLAFYLTLVENPETCTGYSLSFHQSGSLRLFPEDQLEATFAIAMRSAVVLATT
jgi:glycine oxidase